MGGGGMGDGYGDLRRRYNGVWRGYGDDAIGAEVPHYLERAISVTGALNHYDTGLIGSGRPRLSASAGEGNCNGLSTGYGSGHAGGEIQSGTVHEEGRCCNRG